MFFGHNYIKYFSDEDIYGEVHDNSPELSALEAKGKSWSVFPDILKDLFLLFLLPAPMYFPDSCLAPSAILNKIIIDSLIKSGDYLPVKNLTTDNVYNAVIAAMYYGEQFLRQFKDEVKAITNKMRVCEEWIYHERIKYKTFLKILPLVEENNFDQLAGNYRSLIEELGIIIGERELELSVLRSKLFNLLEVCDHGFSTEEVAKRTQKKLKETCRILEGWSIGDTGPVAAGKRVFTRMDEFFKSPKLQRIARRVGRLKELYPEIKRKGVQKSVAGMEFGADLSWVVSDEVQAFFNPARKKLFTSKFIEDNLTVYKQSNEGVKGRGPMIICLDNSGSMQGPKEEVSKALALALLETASRENRDFIAIMFGGVQDRLQVFDFPLGRKTMEQLMEFSKFFICSKGTEFEKPLREATGYLEKHKYPHGDVVFITDGVCTVSDEFLREFLAQKKAMGFRVYSIIVHYGYVSTEVVETFSDEIFLSKDLKGHDVAPKILEKIKEI